jgi:hypothetical protein
MNHKTSKLLSKYASQQGRKARELKRVWAALPHPQRHVERERMRKELDAK